MGFTFNKAGEESVPLNIRPIPDGKGVGFTSMEPLPKYEKSYRYEQVGRYHNFYFTRGNWTFPGSTKKCPDIIMDAFSPNLNKQLHVGHLRNLALAKAYSALMPEARFVALLGKCLGIEPTAEAALQEWFDFLDYHPEFHSDTEVCGKTKVEGTPGEGEYAGCEVWQGAKGPVVIRRSDGTTTYAYHDLAFAKLVGPTHYLTGMEQREHFQNLGFKGHLPMGLILDPITGKKMKSRDGNALSAKEALELVIAKLDPTPEPKKLAWNVLAWNLLHVNRGQDVKFKVDEWTKSESPGMYVSYTSARIISALNAAGGSSVGITAKDVFTDSDIELMGYSEYLKHYINRAVEQLDPAPLANFAHDLARKLGVAYHGEKIVGGRPAFQFAVGEALSNLMKCMSCLGMFPLSKV